eukprot:scaffold9774_cov143-Isochrysis_galbana.AAC.3
MWSGMRSARGDAPSRRLDGTRRLCSALCCHCSLSDSLPPPGAFVRLGCSAGCRVQGPEDPAPCAGPCAGPAQGDRRVAVEFCLRLI